MKSSLSITQKLFWLTVPLVASSAFVATPGQAATFAAADSEATLSNFSQVADQTGTFSDTDTNTLATDGIVTADADANSVFLPNLGANFATAQTSGVGNTYQGAAAGVASGNGLFSIGSGETFSFNFLSSLTLAASVDNPSTESAQASGQVSFGLFDGNNSLLDSFSLVGRATSTNENSIDFISSPYITLASLTQDKSNLGNNLFSTATVAGTYTRTFDSATQLTLAEIKTSQANVNAKPVPEPSELGGAALVAAFLVGLRLKKRARRIGKSA